MRFINSLTALLVIALVPAIGRADDAGPVVTFRVPNGGVQPQAAVDGKGVVHLIYLVGDASRSDIFYIRSTDGGVTWSSPDRVNSQPGSAIAMGTVRGAHLALGRGGRVHVAWMGSSVAEPKAPGNATPMLYTRSTENAQGFEPQRNVVQSKTGLDGGGSISADEQGHVYVAWHAPEAEGAGEQSRRVWLARSDDDGKTFASEQAASAEGGACGCCGMRLFAAADGSLLALYRSADQKIRRDMTLLRIDPKHAQAKAQIVGPMQSAVCVMSTSAFAAGQDGAVLGAWETEGQIYWARVDGQKDVVKGISVPGDGKGRKHPTIATNVRGQKLIAWTEGTGWNRGGSVAWQVYDRDGRPIRGTAGRAEGLPAWGAVAAFSGREGRFVIVY
ncbi:MAG: hypothetical protein JWL69_4053 [Phycisphaerales bacterium]|nr:hypothetical protein [Phycisphaerales bacterium]